MKAGRLLLFLLLGACLIATVLAGNTLWQLIADRELAKIHEIPVYPKASEVVYSGEKDSGVEVTQDDTYGCESMSFTAPDAATNLQDYYVKELIYDRTLLRRGWGGDGSSYPENPVRFYRKARGAMHQLSIYTEYISGKTLVRVLLCRRP